MTLLLNGHGGIPVTPLPSVFDFSLKEDVSATLPEET